MSQYSIAAFERIDTELTEAAPSGAGTPCSDTLLLERFQKGENAALVELYDRHNRGIAIYCMKMIGSHELAKDITQELWIRVLRLRGSTRTIANPIGFFFKIARNLCLNHIESRRLHSSLSTLPESAHPVDESGERPELDESILIALDRLPFEQREVLILNIYCGYRMEEIAAMIGKSPDAVWKRASRARKQLRKILIH